MSDKFLTFDVESAELMEEDPTSRFAWAKIQAFSSGKNRHNLVCDEDTLKKTAPTIYNTPIMYDDIEYRGDFGTHTQAGKSKIAGFVVPNSAEFSTLPDGRSSLNILARIWKMYAPKVIEYFKRTNERKVSVEMELTDSEEMPDGITKMKDFIYTGIQLLGQGVVEASPGANMTFLSFSQEKQEYDEAVMQEFSKYDEVDFTIPESVRSNCAKAIELSKQYGGATSVSLASARYVIKNSVITPEKLRGIYKYLNSHKDKPKNKKQPDNAYISYLCYGGDECYQWSKEMIGKLDELDNKKKSYFSDLITFPYDSMKDANPALKGINPPITVGQANEIARQADAIGSDKGGWGIAISSFKKRHKVVDGHWVKMSEDGENDNMEEFAKEDHGKGEALKVNKSKDKVSNAPWGGVDKTSLMHKVLNANNYKTLVHDVYMIVESGWEDSPSSKLKYPVMSISDGELVYNKHGLSAALGRSEGQGESGVASKVRGIQSKLGLEKEKKEEMSMEDKKDEEKVVMEAEEMATETPEEEKKESPEEEKSETPEEEKKENMSLDSYVDVKAALAILADETEEYKKLAEEYNGGPVEIHYAAKIFNTMYTKYCKMCDDIKAMAADKDVYMTENMALKAFKKDVEDRQFMFEVEQTMSEVSETMPKEKMAEAREDAKNFSMATVDAWKNKTKAMAFSFVKEKKTKTTGFQLPYSGEQKKDNGKLW